MARKKPQQNSKPKHQGYVHINTFLDTATTLFNLSDLQVAGFKAYMDGKHYLYGERDFLPYLEKYLGRKLEL